MSGAGGGHVVIAGGGLGGLRAAEQLRAAGHRGPVTVIGAEPYLPYSRPPLSKELLAAAAGLRPEAAHEKVAFRRRKAIADVTFRLGQPAAAADLAAGKLSLADGRDVAFDGLVVATGLRPRRLLAPGAEPGAARVPLIPGSRVLRTLDDCLALRASLLPGTRLVIVGGGFIGCEVASTALGLGCEVTVIEADPAPLVRVLGEELAAAVQRFHEAAGIRFITGQPVTGAAGLAGGRAAGLVLGGGTEVPAGVIVEAAGSLPCVEWLAGGATGGDLDLSDGVLCDNTLAAVRSGAGGVPVVAAGDVARFPNPLLDEVPRRVEHWAMPAETARRAAATLHALLTGSPAGAAPFAPVPEFWSDQLELRMQSYGTPGVADEARVTEGDPRRLTDGLVAVYHRGGRHVGTVAFNVPVARHRELRAELLRSASIALRRGPCPGRARAPARTCSSRPRRPGWAAPAGRGRQWSETRSRSCSASSLSSLAWSTRLTMAVSSWRSRTHLASVKLEVTT